MTDCEFCGLPNGSLSLSASMLVCEDCVELAEMLEDALDD